jgi:hypothetical protein
MSLDFDKKQSFSKIKQKYPNQNTYSIFFSVIITQGKVYRDKNQPRIYLYKKPLFINMLNKI